MCVCVCVYVYIRMHNFPAKGYMYLHHVHIHIPIRFPTASMCAHFTVPRGTYVHLHVNMLCVCLPLCLCCMPLYFLARVYVRMSHQVLIFRMLMHEIVYVCIFIYACIQIYTYIIYIYIYHSEHAHAIPTTPAWWRDLQHQNSRRNRRWRGLMKCPWLGAVAAPMYMYEWMYVCVQAYTHMVIMQGLDTPVCMDPRAYVCMYACMYTHTLTCWLCQRHRRQNTVAALV